MHRHDRAALLAAVLAQRTGVHVPLLEGPAGLPAVGNDLAVVILDTPDLAEARRVLQAAGVAVDLLGRVGGGDGRALAVVTRGPVFADPVPADFRVLAVMPAFNEADVVVAAVQDLLDQGVDVHLLDNWSTDGTGDLVRGLTGVGEVTVERFPAEGAPTHYEWEVLLHRIEQVALDSGADWCVLHDVDERRRPPWPDRDLRTALHEVGRRGYTAVDHTVWEYHPVDDRFRDGDDVERVLRYWSPPRIGANRTQVKAWRAPGVRVDLAGAGGHEAEFPGRRVFPYNFLLKHYPVRSQRHGERKVLVDRKPRFDETERRRLWHRHYDHVRSGHDFLRSPDELLHDTDGTTEAMLLERVTGTDPSPVSAGRLRPVAVAVLRRSGLRPAFVTTRRAYRIARRRNPETGGR